MWRDDPHCVKGHGDSSHDSQVCGFAHSFLSQENHLKRPKVWGGVGCSMASLASVPKKHFVPIWVGARRFGDLSSTKARGSSQASNSGSAATYRNISMEVSRRQRSRSIQARLVPCDRTYFYWDKRSHSIKYGNTLLGHETRKRIFAALQKSTKGRA